MSTTAHHEIPRSHWLRLWTSLPPKRIHAIAADLEQRYRIDDVELTQTGLGLLPLTDSALGDVYFVGEIPLARAHVRIVDSQGRKEEGGAMLADDRASFARALAILDGAVAARLPGYEPAHKLLSEGASKVAQIDGDRKKMLAATRVDFSLLGACRT